MLIIGEKLHSLCDIDLLYEIISIYIHFLPLYIQFCDHSKCILTDWITQWKNAL